MRPDDFDVEALRGRRADQRWNRMAVGDILERVTWATPEKVALVGWEGAFSDPRFERMTYADADRAANQVAHALLAAGREPGDRVLLYCDNSVEAIITLFGIAKAGMVAVPVNSLLAPDVLAWALGHVGASYVIADACLVERGSEVFAAAGLHPSVVIEIGGRAEAPSTSFAAWIDPKPTHEVDVSVHGDDIWALLFTSGTTSMPNASGPTLGPSRRRSRTRAPTTWACRPRSWLPTCTRRKARARRAVRTRLGRPSTAAR